MDLLPRSRTRPNDWRRPQRLSWLDCLEDWQSTLEGDREVSKALPQTLYLPFKLRDNDVFGQALR